MQKAIGFTACISVMAASLYFFSGGDPSRMLSAQTESPSDDSYGAVARRFMNTARQEAQLGNLQKARELATTAASLAANWQPGEQTPEQFLNSLSTTASNPFSDSETQWPELDADELVSPDKNPFFMDDPVQGDDEALPMNASIDVINHHKAKRLMMEAKAALQDGDYNLARTRAMQARAFNVTWDTLEQRPEELLVEVDKLDGATTFLANGQTTQGSTSPEESYRRAKDLLVQARLAMSQGKLKQAMELTDQADALNVSYGLMEDSPALVRQDLTKLSQPGAAPAAMFADSNSTQTSPTEQQAQALIREARQALTEGRLAVAQEKALQAQSMNVAYGLMDDRPEPILAEVAAALGSQAQQNPFSSGDFDRTTPQWPGNEPVDVTQATNPAQQPFPPSGVVNLGTDVSNGGVELASAQQQDQPVIELPDNMQEMPTMDPLMATANEVDARISRLRTEVMNSIFRAQKLQESDSKEALVILGRTRESVDSADLPEESAAVLTAQLDRAQKSVERWMELKAPMIANEARNKSVREEIEAEIENDIRIQKEIADLVNQYNKLMDQRRYPEAELVALKAKDLDPNLPQSVVMLETAKLQRQIALIEELKTKSDDRNLQQLNGPLEAMAMSRDDYALPDNWEDLIARRSAYGSGPLRTRSDSETRIYKSLKENVSLHFNSIPLTELIRHLANSHGINIALDTSAIESEGLRADMEVSINVDNIRMESALNLVLKQAGGLVYHVEDEILKITNRSVIDSELTTEVYNVADLVVPLTMDQPKSILDNPALNGSAYAAGNGLFQVEDDLSVGIGPNGIPQRGNQRPTRNSRADFTGLKDLLTTTVDPGTWAVNGGDATIEGNENTLSLVIRQTVAVHNEITELLTQLRKLQDLQVTVEVRFISVTDRFFERIGVDFDFNVQDTLGDPVGTPAFGSRQLTFPGGGGGAGGGAGGAQGNDLRGGQAGQAGQAGAATGLFDPVNRVNSPRDDFNGTVVGLASPDAFTQDYDIGFRQGSFELGVPDFGNFNPDAGIQVGMAILSDIEAFFFIQAAQADERSNILFAPKVTIFNGQQATISDQTQRPYIAGLFPVVGTGAVGFQPIIGLIQDGIQLQVTAVISADRRFVRLSLAPQFNNLVDLQTFSFATGGAGGGGIGGQGGGGGFGGQGGGGFGGGGIGGQGGGGFGGGGFGGIGGFGGGGGGVGGGGGGFGGGGGGIGGQGGGGFGGGQQGQQGQAGVGGGTLTTQQPIIETILVSTTVSVPDGGTVLLGGVKRLREGRNMAGVPILNKIPYVSRLFKNSGVGRETESVMLMVTPRIIIHAEEEELILGNSGS